MYLPIFIAILLGLISPAQQTCGNGNSTVYVSNNDPDGNPDEDPDGNPGSPGEDGDGGGHNGDNGQIRPTRP